jgi:hypothetical protein
MRARVRVFDAVGCQPTSSRGHFSSTTSTRPTPVSVRIGRVHDRRRHRLQRSPLSALHAVLAYREAHYDPPAAALAAARQARASALALFDAPLTRAPSALGWTWSRCAAQAPPPPMSPSTRCGRCPCCTLRLRLWRGQRARSGRTLNPAAGDVKPAVLSVCSRAHRPQLRSRVAVLADTLYCLRHCSARMRCGVSYVGSMLHSTFNVASTLYSMLRAAQRRGQ